MGIDKYNDYKRCARTSHGQVVMPTVLHDIAWRAMQIHGALARPTKCLHGHGARRRGHGLADGPTEVHKSRGRQVLRDYKESDDICPRSGCPNAEAAERSTASTWSWSREPVSVTEESAAVGDEPTIADVDKLTAWSTAKARSGCTARASLHFGWQPERDLRAPSGRPPRRHAHPR